MLAYFGWYRATYFSTLRAIIIFPLRNIACLVTISCVFGGEISLDFVDECVESHAKQLRTYEAQIMQAVNRCLSYLTMIDRRVFFFAPWQFVGPLGGSLLVTPGGRKSVILRQYFSKSAKFANAVKQALEITLWRVISETTMKSVLFSYRTQSYICIKRDAQQGGFVRGLERFLMRRAYFYLFGNSAFNVSANIL